MRFCWQTCEQACLFANFMIVKHGFRRLAEPLIYKYSRPCSGWHLGLDQVPAMRACLDWTCPALHVAERRSTGVVACPRA